MAEPLEKRLEAMRRWKDQLDVICEKVTILREDVSDAECRILSYVRQLEKNVCGLRDSITKALKGGET